MSDRKTPKALLATDKATLIDIIGMKIEMNACVHGKKVVE